MPTLTRAVRIIENIIEAEQRLAAALGDAWPAFAAEMQQRLAAIQTLSATDQINTAVNELLFLAWDTPAWPIFQEIMQAADQEDRLADAPRLKSPFTFRGPGDDGGVMGAEPAAEMAVADFQAGVAQAVAQWQQPAAPEMEAAELPTADRYLNAGFFQDDDYLPPDRPLILAHAPYRLRVNIGDPWGPGAPGDPFPQALVDPYFQDDTLPVTIAASAAGPGLQIEPAHRPLALPRSGDSDFVAFTVTPTQTGRQELVVDVLYAGHLLQSRRLTFKVQAAPDEPPPPSAWPAQDGRTTFTRTTALDPALLDGLAQQPRTLTIVSEREPQLNQIGLRFFDHSGAELAFRHTSLQETNLAALLDALRGRLKKLMDAFAVTGGAPLPPDLLTKRLGWLGHYGRSLYRAILPGYRADAWQSEQGQKLQAALRPGAVIQIAPLTAGLSIPWELLYERPLHRYHAEHTRLCDDFRDHGPRAEDCPHYGDGRVLCPHGFWGYRYVIEQLPGRLDSGRPPRSRALPQWIRNPVPSELTGLVYAGGDFLRLDHHWQRLEALAPAERWRLRRLSTWEAVAAFMADGEERPSLVYFYAHGGEEAGAPYLRVADDLYITANDLDAWGTNWRPSAPLLVLNACGSADYSPDSFENLIQDFYRRGAAGVLGAQCTIYEDLVDRMMLPFMQAFLRQTPAGQALLDARRKLLFDQGDPRGLAYSLFAAAELQLAEPVIVLPS